MGAGPAAKFSMGRGVSRGGVDGREQGRRAWAGVGAAGRTQAEGRGRGAGLKPRVCSIAIALAEGVANGALEGPKVRLMPIKSIAGGMD